MFSVWVSVAGARQQLMGSRHGCASFFASHNAPSAEAHPRAPFRLFTATCFLPIAVTHLP